jgi:hypothetical protein
MARHEETIWQMLASAAELPVLAASTTSPREGATSKNITPFAFPCHPVSMLCLSFHDESSRRLIDECSAPSLSARTSHHPCCTSRPHPLPAPRIVPAPHPSHAHSIPSHPTSSHRRDSGCWMLDAGCKHRGALMQHAPLPKPKNPKLHTQPETSSGPVHVTPHSHARHPMSGPVTRKRPSAAVTRICTPSEQSLRLLHITLPLPRHGWTGTRPDKLSLEMSPLLVASYYIPLTASPFGMSLGAS